MFKHHYCLLKLLVFLLTDFDLNFTPDWSHFDRVFIGAALLNGRGGGGGRSLLVRQGSVGQADDAFGRVSHPVLQNTFPVSQLGRSRFDRNLKHKYIMPSMLKYDTSPNHMNTSDSSEVTKLNGWSPSKFRK